MEKKSTEIRLVTASEDRLAQILNLHGPIKWFVANCNLMAVGAKDRVDRVVIRWDSGTFEGDSPVDVGRLRLMDSFLPASRIA